MINITEFSFSDDLSKINIAFDSASDFTSMLFYVGDGYPLNPIDLSSKLDPPSSSYNFTGINGITATELGLPEGVPLSGIFIVNVTNSDPTPDTKEAGIMSDYQLSLCLANKTIQQNQESDLNETNYLFLLSDAIKLYLSQEQYEQALGAYDRAKSICDTDPSNYETDILPCGEGTGCWIIDGVYIIKK